MHTLTHTSNCWIKRTTMPHNGRKPFVSMEKTLIEAEPHLTTNLVKDLLDQAMCPVCHEQMFVPFMTACGHNFCYECLSNWLIQNRNCPTCRSSVDQCPVLNNPLQNLVSSLYQTTLTLLSSDVHDNDEGPHDSAMTLIREKEVSESSHKHDTARGVLFSGVFTNIALRMVDAEDGVHRCGNCNWEVHSNRCTNCGFNLRFPAEMADDAVSVDNSNSEEEDEEDDDEEGAAHNSQYWMDAEENSSDLEFLDDREPGELDLEVSDDLDSLLSDSSGRVPVGGSRISRFLLDVGELDDEGDSDDSLDSDINLAEVPGVLGPYQDVDQRSWEGFDSDSDESEGIGRFTRTRPVVVASDSDESDD